jgi:hypothetical protein
VPTDVLRESDDAKTRACVPELELAVVAAGCHELAVGAEGDRVHVVEVTLLLEDVGLGLPFPHEELA